MDQPRAIIVDGIGDAGDLCRATLAELCDVRVTGTIPGAREMLEADAGAYRLLVVNVPCWNLSTLELMDMVQDRCPWVAAVIAADVGSSREIVRAVNAGDLFGYLAKPVAADDLLGVAGRAVQHGDDHFARASHPARARRLQAAVHKLETVRTYLSELGVAANGAG